VKTAVLKYDPERQRVSLGLKQITPDPWKEAAAKYKVGEKVEGKVVSLTDYGAFVELQEGVEGLIHVSEMKSERVEDPRSVVKEGDVVKAEVITVDPQDRRIGLSMKTVTGREETEGAAEYMAAERQAHRPVTLGDLIREKLGDGSTPEPEKPAPDAAEKSE
jgi:ribosomal protein S1